ncbi:MAG: 50S ribosomal protein L25 [Desulfohalobiaceae bacterium]
MTENVSLQAEQRNNRGKTQTKKLRKEGMVPGIYYNREGTNIPLTVGYGAVQAAYERAQNQVIYLQLKNEVGTESAKPALIWDIQFHPVKGLIEHVDFVGVDMSREVKMEIPVEFTGADTVADNGGSPILYRESVPVSCLPGNIPEKIEVDISELNVGDTVYFSQITLTEGVSRDAADDLWIVGVSATHSEQTDFGEEEEGSAGEGEEEGEA